MGDDPRLMTKRHSNSLLAPWELIRSHATSVPVSSTSGDGVATADRCCISATVRITVPLDRNCQPQKIDHDTDAM
ncbi:hypothetical protein Trco_000741 [Trichoderma cornu-damae]|uniref:Uncharacterized protein n=1 Tax=Trichoderma cornu-damae TaxID=654480 RepID=A0A9P8QQW1_9HYPO|nr:hypothetical protein Trco_000741 [Trichoderma cornu-damae]